MDALNTLPNLTSFGAHGDESEASDAALLRLRAAHPKLMINGVWLAPQAIEYALNSAT